MYKVHHYNQLWNTYIVDSLASTFEEDTNVKIRLIKTFSFIITFPSFKFDTMALQFT